MEKIHKVSIIYSKGKKLDGFTKDLHIEDENVVTFLNSIVELDLQKYVIIKVENLVLTFTKDHLRHSKVHGIRTLMKLDPKLEQELE